MNQPTILRMSNLCLYTGLKPSTIYKHIKSGNFPAPVKLTRRASGWLASDVSTWLSGRQEGGV